MNGRQLRNATALLALACAFPVCAFAQALKTGIVGSWTVAAVEDRYDNGKSINHWGMAKGQLTFDANGRFSQIIIGDTQPALKSPDPRKPDAPVVAYFGSYSVDEARKTVTFNIESASWSGRAGSALTADVEVKGNTLSLVGAMRKDQLGSFRPHNEYKRAPAL
jgi:hypothetical protein